MTIACGTEKKSEGKGISKDVKFDKEVYKIGIIPNNELGFVIEGSR